MAKTKPQGKQFSAFRFADQAIYDVAEHEVFMCFHNDDDAGFFQEWWHEQGAVAFNRWLEARPVTEQ